MSKIKKFWPIILIAFLIIVFFWKFFFKGLIPFPADFIVGVYYPWLDYNWGFPTGVPVKNPLLADVPSLFYPLKSFIADLFRQGKLPLWNPLQFGGYPLLANFQSGALNPTNLFYLFLSKPYAWAWQTVLQPLLIAIFTYLFLRNLKLTKIASIFGGMIFAFSGFSLIWLEYNIHGYVIVFIPLLLFLLDRWLEKKQLIWGLFLSLALSLQIFMGYPQVVIYTLALLLFYFWFRLDFKIFNRDSIKTHLILGILVLLGLTLSAVQLIPGWELFSLSQRVEEGVSGGLEVAFLPWQQLITLIAPDFFGNPATYNYWGPGNYTNGVGYSGIIGLILAMVVVFRSQRKRLVYFFGGLFIGSLILALPTPIAKVVSNLGFLGLKAATATRILCLTNFSIAVLAALAVESIVSEKKKIRIARIPLVFGLIILGLMIGIFLSRQIMPFSLNEVVNLKVSLRNLILPLALSVATLALLWLLRVSFLKKLSIWLLFFLLVFELFRFGWKFTPFSEARIIFPTTPVLEFLQEQKKPVRINTGDAIPISMWMPYGLESASGYDAVYPERWARLINVINGGKVARMMGRYGAIEKYDSQLFDLTNTCFILAVKQIKEGGRYVPDKTGKPGSLFQLAKFNKVFEDGTVEVLENSQCLPRAFMVYSYRVESDPEKIINLLGSSDFDLSNEIILEKEPESEIEKELEVPKEKEEIVWLEYEPGQEIIQLENENPGWLFLVDSFYPGWKVFIDDKETLIYRANFAFRAIFVPAGKHKIRFIYDPLSFRIGLAVSLISLIILGGLFLYETKNRRRASPKYSS
ncbi:MAG TPA: YfhO family protein [Patescibacteria group bacterium]|nr:YfhO family protein [Patescibacteria group bacterium]